MKQILTDYFLKFLKFVKVDLLGNIIFVKENRVPALLVTNAFIFSTLFIVDYRSKESFGSRKAIGNIVFKKNSVQRKFDNRVIWSTLEINNPISNKDSIKTDSLADAIIKLNDGTEIHVDENTMILLDFSGFRPVLKFSEGSVKIKKSSDKSFFSTNLVIQSGSQTVEIGKSDVKLKKNNENLDVFVEKGEAKVISGNNSKYIEEGMSANLNMDQIVSKKIILSLNYPPDKIRIIDSGETAEVDFSWNGSEKGELYLELSRGTGFTKHYLKTRAPGDKHRLSLPEGTYYWRVSAKIPNSPTDEFSESRKLIVITDSAIKLFSPRNNANFNFKENPPSIDFHWNKRYLSSGYSLVISKSPDFKEKVENYESGSNNLSISNLAEGSYYWKVISKSELTDIPIRNSSVHQFKISKINITLPAPVILKSPVNEHKIDPSNPDNLTLEWESSNSKEYQIQISQSSDFTKTVLDLKVSNLAYNLKKTLPAGNYYWRVKDLENGGDFSKPFSFTIPEIQKSEEVKKPVEVLPKKIEPEVVKEKQTAPVEQKVEPKPSVVPAKKPVIEEGPQVKPRRPTKETEDEREKRRKIELEKFNEYLKL